MRNPILYATLFIVVASFNNVSAGGLSILGDLEILNDVGLSKVRESVGAYNKTRTVMGVPAARNGNKAAVANRAYGQARNGNITVRNINDIPRAVRDIQEIERYTRALTK